MEYEKYNQVIKTTANKNNLPYVDAFNVLQGKVETDGWDPIYPVYQFHPNIKGLNILVDLIQGQLLMNRLIKYITIKRIRIQIYEI